MPPSPFLSRRRFTPYFLLILGLVSWAHYTISACFSPDGTAVLTVHYDKKALFWSVDTGRSMGEVWDENPLRCAAFSPDQRVIALMDYEAEIAVYDFNARQITLRFPVNGVSRTLAFTPDSRYVITDDGAAAHFWDVRTGKQVKRFASSHPFGD